MLSYQIAPHRCGHGYHLTGNGMGEKAWTRTVEQCLRNAAHNAFGRAYEVKQVDAEGTVVRTWEFTGK